MLPLWLQLIFVISFGLVGGSFATAWLWRIKTDNSVAKGRSKCRECHNVLSWGELIPVLSWVMQKGRCRQCGSAISWQYPLIELTTASLFVAVYLARFTLYESTLVSYALLLILAGITVVAVVLFYYDLFWMILPNQAVAAFGIVAAILVGLDTYIQRDYSLLLNRLLCASILFIIFYLIYQFKDGKYIGGGDVKLLPLLGFILSFEKTLLMIFLASTAGSIVGITMIIARKQSKQIPFGPFLLSSFFIMFLFGDSIVNAYSTLVLGY